MRRTFCPLQTRHAAAAAATPLSVTALHDFHRAMGAHMGPFAGYAMPIFYKSVGLLREHMATRQAAGLFDVSHMGQYEIHGAARERFVEYATPADMRQLALNQSALTMLLNAQGGIVDDCVVTRRADCVAMVLNAGCKAKDVAHLEALRREFAQRGEEVRLVGVRRALIALQGPRAAEILGRFAPQVHTLSFMHCLPELPIPQPQEGATKETMVVCCTRSGYTGEDGFELAVDDAQAVPLAQMLVKAGAQLAGLGARDTLRLEAGLNLYGHELDETTSPVAARLLWCISPRRLREGGFVGHERVAYLKQHAQTAVPRVRVGVKAAAGEGHVARRGAAIEKDGKVVGTLTSGAPSPCLKQNIGLGYVDRAVATPGSAVQLVVRGRRIAAEIAALPFVPHRYVRKAAKSDT